MRPYAQKVEWVGLAHTEFKFSFNASGMCYFLPEEGQKEKEKKN